VFGGGIILNLTVWQWFQTLEWWGQSWVFWLGGGLFNESVSQMLHRWETQVKF